MREKLSITKSRAQEKNKLLVTGSNRHVLRQRNDARTAMPIAAQALHIPQATLTDASGSRGFTRKSKSITVPQLSQLIINQ